MKATDVEAIATQLFQLADLPQRNAFVHVFRLGAGGAWHALVVINIQNSISFVKHMLQQDRRVIRLPKMVLPLHNEWYL